MRYGAGPNNTDDALRVNDNNGIMMPNGLNRSSSQNNMPEISNQNPNGNFNEFPGAQANVMPHQAVGNNGLDDQF